MKKFFLLTAIFFLSLTSAVSAQSDYNFVRVSDLNAQEFVDTMKHGNIYKTLKQNETTVAFTTPAHHPELDDTQNLPDLSVYRALFGIQGTQTPNGQLLFYVDAEGYVWVVQVINQGDAQLSGVVLLMAMEAIGLNDQEAAPLLQAQTPNAETFCSVAGRKILRVVADRQGNKIMLFGASN